jgi:WD40 repeat protein
VQRWDLETARQAALVGHESWVFGMAFHPDGETIVTAGGDGRLIWWPAAAESPEPARRVPAHQGWARSVAVSPDGASIATCGNDRHVKLWSFDRGELLFDLPAHTAPVYRVGFDPSGQFLLSADLLGSLIQWDARTGKEARRLDAAKLHEYNNGQGVDYGGVRDLAFSADGKLLACGGLIEASNPLGAVNTPAIVLFDWETGRQVRLQRPKEALRGVVWGLRFHPSGFLIAATGGSGGGNLLFFRPDQANEFFKLKLPNTARALDLHPDGLRLATAHFDNQVRICLMRPKPA